jgi:NADH pyrophosphatase NudC (nudix superfamily)
MKELDNSNNFQKTEVSNMKWLTYEQVLKHIRPYNSELIDIVKKVNRLIKEYTII